MLIPGQLLTAFKFLTRVPLPGGTPPLGAQPQGDGQQWAGLAAAAWAFPLAGAVVGLVAGGALLAAFALGLHPLACGLIAVCVAAALTGALHEDGLADAADGFGGGHDRAAKLAIMRDSRIGTYGVLAVVFSVGLRASAVAGFQAPSAAFWGLVAAMALSRAMMVPVMHWLAPARIDGLGAGAGRPGRPGTLLAVALGLGAAALALGPETGLWLLAVGLGAAAAVAWIAWRQIGGHSGDVLGTVQQVAETALLLAAVALAE